MPKCILQTMLPASPGVGNAAQISPGKRKRPAPGLRLHPEVSPGCSPHMQHPQAEFQHRLPDSHSECDLNPSYNVTGFLSLGGRDKLNPRGTLTTLSVPGGRRLGAMPAQSTTGLQFISQLSLFWPDRPYAKAHLGCGNECSRNLLGSDRDSACAATSVYDASDPKQR